jgi:hypothetical protein
LGTFFAPNHAPTEKLAEKPGENHQKVVENGANRRFFEGQSASFIMAGPEAVDRKPSVCQSLRL